METLKRVVFTVSNDLNYDQRMQRICYTLHEAGYDVTLVGRRRRSSNALADQPYKQVRLNLWFDKGKMFYVELSLRLFFYLLTKPFDVVCGIDLDTIVPCWFASKLKSKPCVYDAHELFTEVPEVIDRPRVQNVWRKVESFVVTRITYFYTVSESVAEEFDRRYQKKPAVIRNLPLRNENALVKSDNQNQVKQIIYRGAVNAGRGVEQAIEAMALLNGVRLLVAGDGGVLHDVEQLTHQLRLTDKVTFSGYATPQQLDVYTKDSWLGLNLLNGESLNYRFSLANKFFDYIQCGIPQITMRFPEYERVNREHETAVLIDDLKPATIAHAVNKLLSSPSRYAELKLNCTKAAAELCWENERTKLLDFYRTLP